MKKTSRFARSILTSPILWGLAATVGFYSVLHGSAVKSELFQRYFSTHPVQYVETMLFMLGGAALVLKGLSLWRQRSMLGREPIVGQRPHEPLPPEAASELTIYLEELPARQQETYLARRFRDALEHVSSKGSADRLDEELRYLGETDEFRANNSFSFVRIIVWAIPILGFLGTVVGITLAIANLAPEALTESLPQVVAGLAVAFDTTALGLGLTIPLMFAMYFAEQAEQSLLNEVDTRVQHELAGRFQLAGTGSDPQLTAIRRMADAVVQTTERMVHRQAEVWQATIDAAHARWSDLGQATQEQVESGLERAVVVGLQAHAQTVAETQQTLVSESHHYVAALRESMGEGAQQLGQLQHQLTEQTALLLRVVEATGRVTQLEEALNRNLGALSGSQNFEETLHSLSAAVHLLSGRLGHASAGGGSVELQGPRPESQAA